MPVRTNKLKAKLREGKPVFWSAVRLPEPGLVEALGYAGFDFVLIDGEHGAIGPAEMDRMILAAFAAETTPIVRVVKNDPELVMRALDIGAMGILAPHIRNADDVRRFRDGCLYSPDGQRGVGIGRAGRWGGVPLEEYFRTMNAEIAMLAMIEDVEAIENIEAIVPLGLDVLMVGTYDLAASYGLPGQLTHPTVQAAADRVVEVARRHNVPVGYPARDPADAQDALRRGFRVIFCGGAEAFVYHAARSFLNAVRL